MSKEIKHALSGTEGLIPKLRFPEFEKDGEWITKNLGEVAKVITGNTPNTKERSYYGGEMMFVSPSDISDSRIINQTKSTLSKLGFSKTRQIKANSVLFVCIGSTIGKVAQNKYECATNQQINSLVSNKGYSSDLLYSLLDYNSSKIASMAGNHAIPIINKTDFSDIKIDIPPRLQEQQKIASCLSSLDELLTAHNDKLEALKNHKKGLMQNLFPQEGETAPKYRFPEFENDGDWEENSLDNVAKFSKGKGISKADISENGKLPCIRYGELYTHYNETISVVKSHTNLSPSDLVLSKANDVIIPASGETQIDIATASCVLDNGIALGGDLNIIRTKINGVFLSYYLNNVMKREIAQMAQGISVVHLYSNQLKTLTLRIPNPKEQQKIASCLSALDEIIMAQTEKIEQLKEHKKGLMQGLFPKIIEHR